MKKINLWLIRQDCGKKWKCLVVVNNHPCQDLTKCVSERLYKEAKKMKGDWCTLDLVAIFAAPSLSPDERDLMMDCACAIEDTLRKERGLKLMSVSCLDDCNWVRWFTSKDLKRHRKVQKKLEKERSKQ